MKLFGRGLAHRVAILLATVLMVGGSAPVASPIAAASEESHAAAEDSPFVQPEGGTDVVGRCTRGRILSTRGLVAILTA